MEIDLTGSYPIVLNGEETGTLSVTRDGLYWVFDAKCAPRAELVRLTVFGGDGEGYLGVMEPCGDALVLTKRLSRAALAGFPSAVTHAGNRGEAADATVQSPPSTEAEASGGDADPQNEDKPPSGGASLPPAVRWLPCPCPCSLFSGLVEKSALGAVRGARFAQWDGRTLLAVPLQAAAALPYGLVPFLYQAKISRETVLICVIEDGKAVRSLA